MILNHHQNCKYLFNFIMPSSSSKNNNNNNSCFNRIIILLVFLIVTCFSEFNYAQQSSSSSNIDESNVYSSVNLGSLVQKLIILQNKQLYVGGRNFFLSVNPLTMNVIENFTIGPIADNYNCPPSPVMCNDKVRTVTQSDCINLFSINVSSSAVLMACYSTNQGMCYVIPQANFKAAKLLGDPSNVKNYVASRSSSVVVSIADEFSDPRKPQSIMFVAHAYDNRPLNLSPPTISKRKLVVPINMAYWTDSQASVTARDVRQPYKNFKWPINYIYGFKHEDYVFFVKTEPESLTSTQRVTKIIRICIGDTFFGSYSEVQVNCNKQTVVTSATLGKMDNYLRNTLDSQQPLKTSDVLFLAFENTKLNKPASHTHSESRVCAFAMDHLMNEFETARNACYARRDGKLIETFVEPGVHCNEHEHQQCQQSANMFIEVTKQMEGYFLYGDKQRITSMVPLLQGSRNSLKYALFIGMENGLVKKIVSGRDVFTIELSKSRIEPDPVIDSKEENIFIATGQSLIKLPVKTCSYYRDCGSCIESFTKDTIDCAWTGKSCAVRDGNVVTVSHCEPKLISFSPSKGPTQGGTVVNVKGLDLGSHDETENTENSITVAGRSCSIISWNYTEIECKIVSSSDQSSSNSGPIVIKVKDISARKGYDIIGTVKSTEYFQFVVPSVTSVKPLISPLTGGVNVAIHGTNLDIGSNLEILLAGVQCKPLVVNPNAILCVSGSAKSQGEPTQGPIGVNIDSASITTNFTFSYFIDPIFLHISPNVTSATSAVNITVIGDHFDSLFQPRLIVSAIVPKSSLSPLTIESDCTLINVTSFTCPSPIMPSNVYFESPITSTVTFTNGGSSKQFPTEFILVYLPDPKFSDKIVATSGLGGSRTLEIMGQHLHTGYGMKVILVNQQDGTTLECKDLRSIDGNLIACNIPLEDYPGDPTTSLWNISVITGTKRLFVGMVPIEPEIESESSTIAGIIVGMVAALVVITLIMMYLLKRNGYLLTTKKGPPSLGVAYRSPENGFQRQGSQNEYHPTGSRISGQPLLFDRQSDEIKFVIDPDKQVELQNDGILFSRDYLTREKVIGQGNFGLVFQGYLKLPNKQDEKIKVAIKTLKTERGILSQEKGEAFLAEGLIMKEFCHENVLSLVGVSIDFDGSPMIITPFMEHGDLRSYIQQEDLEFTVIQLIQFGVQVAQGMVYLAGLKFVHRDLAARNCMVDEHQTVKVADFGLSRDVYTTSYYSDADNVRKPLPRKWMAIESLERGNYDTKSDVWSYGVLLWELLTRGDIPYPDVEDWKMKDYLKVGYRLPRPEHCPPEVYSVMKECWVEDPKSRPTFEEILKLIEVAIESNEKKYLEQKTNRNIRYINDPSIFSNPEYDGSMIIKS